jgi:hypothetical protein
MYKEENPLNDLLVKDINCACDHKILYEQIFGSPDDQPNDVMAYKSCKHTLYAAAKRQMKAAPTPDPDVADEFVEYSKTIFQDEVGEDLTHFGYSYQQWYQHLNLAKQRDMDLVAQTITDDGDIKINPLIDPAQMRKVMQINYEGICKVELQKTNGKPRMVCSIPLRTKYIMGPICWRLEEIMSHKFKGYCGGKNLTEMGDQINKYIDQGFTKVVEGDGSAFDNTQDITLKRIDHYLYEQVKHAVYHVPQDVFINVATEPYKTMDLIYMNPETKKREKLFQYSILGSVFSGDCDTTLCNTLRMALYNRFVNDKAGLIYGQDYIVFSKGDDFTVMYKPYITDERINAIYYKYFLPANPNPKEADRRVFGLGQVLKMLDIGGPEIIKFCSLRAWVCDKQGHIILTRDPSKFSGLSKYSRKTKCYNNTQKIQYLIDQAEALESSYKGIHYFDTMAKAYRIKANQIIKTMTSNKKEARILKNILLTMQRPDRRKAQCEYVMPETPVQQKMYDIDYRKESIKIQQDFWETMKSIEKINTRMYSREQLKYINQQVDAEFNSEELKSMLGLKKEDEHEN